MVIYASEEEQRFFEAAYNENTRLVTRMLSKNPKLANSSNGIASPLYIAVRHRCHRMAEILIDHGADVNAGLLEEGDMFCKGDTPLIGAIQSNSSRCLNLLIRNGAELNFLNAWGYCPLTVAVEYYRSNLFKLLLESGADPDLENSSGWRPIQYVSHLFGEGHRQPFMKLLLKYGADMGHKSPTEITDEEFDNWCMLEKTGSHNHQKA